MKRLLGILVLLPAAARACPGCQESVSVGAGGSSEILAGFSWSVLFLLAAVFGALGAISFLIARTCRRVEAGRANS